VFAGAVPAAPLNDVAQALENPYVTERDRVRELTQPGGQKTLVLAPPIHFAGENYELEPAPVLGGDTDDLLDELGYDAETQAKLRENGVG
jgi:crotonobetainyl-CoA:carnitine CoA-transferase CaiB-like acyl-CoA transferase